MTLDQIKCQLPEAEIVEHVRPVYFLGKLIGSDTIYEVDGRFHVHSREELTADQLWERHNAPA